ncbi:MAG: septation protein IspZ [SAR86 cluster bacterium]|jgi:intracellular septation protein|nr:septation protein IspZ [SAR86 cluster bacterium]
MKQFNTLLPVLIFVGVWIFTKDIILATGALMIALTLQVGHEKLTRGSVDKKLLFTWLLVVVLGGATLVLRDPIFIQWKVSIVNWLFALILLGFSYFRNSYLMKDFIEEAMPGIPDRAWKNATNLMSLGFIIIGLVNLYFVFYTSLDTWVYFKLFGVFGISFVFITLTIVYLSKFMSEAKLSEEN